MIIYCIYIYIETAGHPDEPRPRMATDGHGWGPMASPESFKSPSGFIWRRGSCGSFQNAWVLDGNFDGIYVMVMVMMLVLTMRRRRRICDI